MKRNTGYARPYVLYFIRECEEDVVEEADESSNYNHKLNILVPSMGRYDTHTGAAIDELGAECLVDEWINPSLVDRHVRRSWLSRSC
jgi:hypothetical protein